MVRRLQGTPWHVDVIGRKEDDPRRHKSRCKYYHKGEQIVCSFYNRACVGSAHCDGYKEKTKEDLEIVSSKKTTKKNVVAEYAIPDDLARAIYPIGIEVVHVKYGTGIVKHIKDNKNRVEFENGEKNLNVDICVKNGLMQRKN